MQIILVLGSILPNFTTPIDRPVVIISNHVNIEYESHILTFEKIYETLLHEP
jgi:hypothetical protein